VPEDSDLLEMEIIRSGARLVVVDPLVSYLSTDVNSHKDQDIRRAMAALTLVAERTGAAIVSVRHLNKGGGDKALYRGGGSIGMIGAARAGFLLGVHPDDSDVRVLSPTKMNVGKEPPAIEFRLREADGEWKVPVVEWGAETDLRANDLLGAPSGDDLAPKRAAAQTWLLAQLEGGPMPAKQIYAKAAEVDIAEMTLRRAKAALGVDSVQQADGWIWYPPSNQALSA
jgi:hypothetical protein